MLTYLKRLWRETFYVSECCESFLFTGTIDGITPEPFCVDCLRPTNNVRATLWQRIKLVWSDLNWMP